MTTQFTSQVTVYVIFTGADSHHVDYIEEKLGNQGIELLRYDKQLYAGRRFDAIYRDWADKADAILLLVSNAWNDMQDYMDGELAIIQQKQAEWHKKYGKNFLMKLKTGESEKRSLQIVFPLAVEPLVGAAHDTAAYFGDYEQVQDETIDRFIIQFITRVKNIKRYIASQSTLSSNQSIPLSVKPIPIQTSNLQTPKFALHEFLKKPVSSIWTSPAKAFTLDQKISSLSWTGDILHIRHFPVVDEDGRLISIVSLRDILEAELPDTEVLDWLKENQLLETGHLSTITPTEISVRDIVQEKLGSKPISIRNDLLIADAIELLSTRHTLPGSAKKRYISALPGTDKNGTLIGIMSYLDILSKVQMPYVPQWVRQLRSKDEKRSVGRRIRTLNDGSQDKR